MRRAGERTVFSAVGTRSSYALEVELIALPTATIFECRRVMFFKNVAATLVMSSAFSAN